VVKILKRRSLGIQPVYDLGVEKDHNFVLNNHLIASNCFNKSHSTAYAYVTYQTAYLKANYTVEYMAALLTASSDNQDKVEKYRDNCQKMGINVLAPDINNSDIDFKPIGKNTILFGLSAVKNLGQGAIETILQAREEAGGNFESFADFCLRVDLRVVNRRALETLIYCGAFDQIQANRNQLITDLDLIISWAHKKAKEQETGQTNLFDLCGGNEANNNQSSSKFDEIPHSKSVPDFSVQDKLRLEKEHLGFYVSDHPLKAAFNLAKPFFSPITLDELDNQKTKARVSIIAMVTNVKKITTKKGEPMAFVQFEDILGQAEGVVFPSTYPNIEQYLIEDSRLIVWGKVERRDEQPTQLIVEDIEPLEMIRMVMLELELDQVLNPSIQNNLKGILQEQSGDKYKSKVPVVGIIKSGMERQFIRFGQEFWVQDYQSAIHSLNLAKFKAYPEPLITE
jgi:DNA polymerase-3 subunit alpha